MNRKQAFYAVAATAALAFSVWFFFFAQWSEPVRPNPGATAGNPAESAEGTPGNENGADAAAPGGAATAPDAETPGDGEEADGNDGTEPNGEIAPEDEKSPEEIESEAVEAFDAKVDAWMNPDSKQVSMDNVYEFADAFRRVPASRRMECLQRALNLVPDENAMLLAGILMDKSLDKEYIETVFNDVLNRGESLKKTLMEQIYKDKSHPCWADVAWIFDATGEKTANSNQEIEENDQE